MMAEEFGVAVAALAVATFLLKYFQENCRIFSFSPHSS
jgi:hypothetical protein